MSVHPLAADGYPVGPALRRGLTLLLKAKSLAADVGRDVWDFAVEADRLRAEGLTECDLRWLTCRGLVEHAREADPLSPRRWFAGPGGLNFPPATCFVLTDLGEAFAAEYQRPAGAAGPTPSAQSTAALLPIMVDLGTAPAPPERPPGTDRTSPDRPAWDASRRELRVGGRLIKRFRVPARVQELILTAFEEEGWPPRIDDPLPASRDAEPKRRLQAAVLSLNRNRHCPLVRFHGDGNGTGVQWSLRPADDANPQ